MRMFKERDLWLLTVHQISEKLESEYNIRFFELLTV